jgi:hypothetical protein
MRYLIAEQQEGEGCDYTIGCGMRFYFEDFDGPLDEAVKHFTTKIAYPDGEEEGLAIDGDNALAEVWIVPADGAVALDLAAIREADKKMRAEAKKREKEASEKAEFERLRQKFGA